MGQTIAESIHEEGKREGKREGACAAKRQSLLMLLRARFGRKVTPRVAKLIETTTDTAQLDAWLRNFATAAAFEDVGLPAKRANGVKE